MSKTQKIVWWAVGVVVVVGVVWWGIARNIGSKSSSHQVTIGVILPLTGDLSVTGEKIYNGVLLAAANAPSNVKFIYEDDHSNVTDGVTAATKLLNVDNVDMIMGTYESDETIAVAPLAKAQGKEIFSFSFCDDDSSARQRILRLSERRETARNRHPAHPKAKS